MSKTIASTVSVAAGAARVRIPENVQAARHLVRLATPYFNSLNWAATLIARPGLGTMAIDKRMRLYIDPDAVEKWPITEVAVALIHEYLHVINRHHSRIPDNIAADLAINSWIEEMLESVNQQLGTTRITLTIAKPADWLYPDDPKFGFPKGLLMEEYHALLQQRAEKQGKGRDKGDGKDADDGKPSVGRGKCGSCATKGDHPWEEPQGEDEESGMSEGEVDLAVRMVAEDIMEHQKRCGNLPGGLKRWAETALAPPKVPWQTKLRGAARRAINWAQGHTTTTWRKINRRSTNDILMPGLMSPVPSIALVIDTSGSMSEQNLARALAETQGVLRALGLVRTPVLAVDAAVNTVKRVADARHLDLVGGGGTDMTLGIQTAFELRPKPQVIIVMTDGYTGWPELPFPGVKVIACLVQKGAAAPPGWIQTIEIDD